MPTFSDAIALVRQRLWASSATFGMSYPEADILKVSRPLFHRLIESACYAA